ncbi:hypothetical protein SLS53_000257 [Cytospora paraplurivora]|uniref:Uncharacterized protein n=1 Tax=Cytospora paraplurivora TaxID=2898453 RepID=A0AAN9UX52_9PEZI
MHEARYPEQRQVELLLFHRFVVVPRLGPKPSSSKPKSHSRVAPGVGDGSPIGYSWRWGTGPASKPLIRHYIEPIGPLTGTPADPLNEIAAKGMLWDLKRIVATTDLSLLWKFASHIRPNLTNEETRRLSGSSMLVGVEWAPDSGTVDIMAGLMTRAPSQVRDMLHTIFPAAMRDAYGAGVSLSCLDKVRDFISMDSDGKTLTVLGTTAIDCCSPEVSRFKVYVTTENTAFDHIAAVMTLANRIPVPSHTLEQLRELWYGLKGLPMDFPSSEQPPGRELAANGARSGPIANANLSGVTFYFDIHPKYHVPQVKLQVDVSKHAANDLAAIEAVTGFLRRRGQAHDAAAYLNVVRGMVADEDLGASHGFQAFFAFAVKQDEIDVTSYFLPQVYRRFAQVRGADLSPRQRRSRFDSF